MKKRFYVLLGLTLIAFSILLLASCGKARVPAGENYRFSFTYGWDVAQGAIPVR